MKWTAWVPLLAAALVATLGASAPGERKPADRVWTRPGLENCNLRCIAILPPGSDAPARALEDRWLLRAPRDGHAWLPSVMVMDHLVRGPRRAEALLAQIQARRASSGEVDSASVTQVARAMGADAILSLRIDRRERLGGGSRTVARVGATCVLQDSSGRLLWKVTGE